MGRFSMRSEFPLVVACLVLGLTAATRFQDCGGPSSKLHFTSIVSTPDPVITKLNQTITKHGWSDIDVPSANLTAEFSQYYCFVDCKNGTNWNTGLPWIRFLKLNLDICSDHPDMCPLKAGKNFTTSAKHPPLNPLTPHGWYRSRQVYHVNGEQIGCADMIVQFTSADDEVVPLP